MLGSRALLVEEAMMHADCTEKTEAKTNKRKIFGYDLEFGLLSEY